MLGFNPIGSAPIGGNLTQRSTIAPTGDLITTGWTPSSGTVLYDMIDEVELSTADYITSPELTVSLNPVSFAVPEISTGNYRLRFNALQTGDAAQARLVLKDSLGTVVGTGTWHNLTNEFITYDSVVNTTGIATSVTIETYVDVVPENMSAPITSLLAGF